MKVGFLINDLNAGGAERAVASLANYFVNHDIQAQIVTFSNEKSFYSLDKKVKHSPLGFEEIEHSVSLKRISESIKRIVLLRKFVKAQKLDFLIGMSFYMTWYAVFATVFTKTKIIGTERNNPYKYAAGKINTLLRKLFYHFCDGYIFQTYKSAKFFTKNLKKSDTVIPNAIFNETVCKLSPPAEREKIICAVGRLNKQKRFDLLIDAFSSIAREIPDYRLVIFGEGELRNELQKRIDNAELSNRISMPGTNPEVLKFVNKASVFVLSSDYEGMPNVLMEALALGVPCISTRCDMGPEELIINGENGILVDTGSSEQIAATLLNIIKNPELAKKLSKSSMKLRETHSIDEISKKWIEYLQTL